MTIRYAAALMLAFSPSVSPAAAAPPIATSASAEVEQPLTALSDAMRKRDVAALDKALARSVEPQIVYYWGDTVTGRDEIMQWHREWFAETGWSIEPGPVGHALVGDRLATLTAPMRYIKSAERQFKILINYTLIKEAEGWKVARMQQTLLEGPP